MLKTWPAHSISPEWVTLRELRIARGISQKQLSALLGFSLYRVRQLELGDVAASGSERAEALVLAAQWFLNEVTSQYGEMKNG